MNMKKPFKLLVLGLTALTISACKPSQNRNISKPSLNTSETNSQSDFNSSAVSLDGYGQLNKTEMDQNIFITTMTSEGFLSKSIVQIYKITKLTYKAVGYIYEGTRLDLNETVVFEGTTYSDLQHVSGESQVYGSYDSIKSLFSSSCLPSLAQTISTEGNNGYESKYYVYETGGFLVTRQREDLSFSMIFTNEGLPTYIYRQGTDPVQEVTITFEYEFAN